MYRKALVVLASLLLAGTAHAAKGDARAGKAKAAPCVACHGESGVSAAPEFPKIAGQHADYLAAALRHYKAGKRKNPIMGAQVANLSEKDMLDLAAYYASQPGLAIRY